MGVPPHLTLTLSPTRRIKISCIVSPSSCIVPFFNNCLQIFFTSAKILTNYLKVSIGRRFAPTYRVRMQHGRRVLKRAGYACEWKEGGMTCGLKDGENDPVGGGRVKLTPDHKNPHSLNPDADPKDTEQWQALCGRHQVTKKNYWDTTTGKLNTYAIVQFAPEPEKRDVFYFLLSYFGYTILEDGSIMRCEI